MSLRRLLPCLFLAIPVGCPSTRQQPDAGIDAGADAGSDAGLDGGRDAGPDAGMDAGLDAGPDAGPDGGLDAGFDAGSDAGVDAGQDGGNDGGLDGGPDSGVNFCALPGSVVYLDGGSYTVPGADAGLPDFSWLTVPDGFCVHHYAVVGNARQLRFAPGGELFVASPSAGTTSNGPGGLGAVVVVPDDNQDGFGDQLLTYATGLAETQGMLFANNSFYYQDGTQIMSEPYVMGQRTDNPNHTLVADITVYVSGGHWPKTLDISDTGQIFVGNGGDQGEMCLEPMPFHGGILEVDGANGADGGVEVAMGLRNPIDVKCHRDGNNQCFATELVLDFSGPEGGREKLIPIRAGDNWGYPCCASANLPYENVTAYCGNPLEPCTPPTPDCSGVAQDTESFWVSNTPFGFDFVDDQFPTPWNDQIIVAVHGAFGSWIGARIVAITFDPQTGNPLPANDDDGGVDTGAMVDFATGWDDGLQDHGRPTDIEMSPDGRIFVSNDQNGEIFWIAPVTQ
jgi:glucose/arabinose dehydrogenase